VSGVRIPSLTPLKPQVRRPGRDRGRAIEHDHYPSLGADLRISAAHGGDFWEPILRPALRGQPELLTGRSVKDPGAAGTPSPGPRTCLIDRPPSQTAPAATGQPSPELNGGTDGADHDAVTLPTDRDAPRVFAGFRSRPTAKRHSGPRPCHRGRSGRGYLLRRVRAASADVFSSHAKRCSYVCQPLLPVTIDLGVSMGIELADRSGI
jgi:hypothetical protein